MNLEWDRSSFVDSPQAKNDQRFPMYHTLAIFRVGLHRFMYVILQSTSQEAR